MKGLDSPEQRKQTRRRREMASKMRAGKFRDVYTDTISRDWCLLRAPDCQWGRGWEVSQPPLADWGTPYASPMDTIVLREKR